jgi:PAS domain S-box-containing protein
MNSQSVQHEEGDISYKRRYVLVRTSLIIVSIIGSLFSIINYQRGLYILATTEVVVFAACLFLLYILKRRERLYFVSLTFILICCALGLIASGDPQSHLTVVVWIALGPLLAFFLLGKRLGAMISITFCAAATGLFFWNHTQSPNALPLVAVCNILIFLISVLTLSFYFESTRADTEDTLTKDIAERKRIEEILKKSEQKYRDIVMNSIADTYYECDLKGRITFINEAGLKMTGYSREELMGRDYRHYSGEKSFTDVLSTFNEVYRTGIPQIISEREILLKDGSARLVDNSVSLMKDADGKAVGFRGILRDVTERKRAEETLQIINEELQSTYRELEDFSFSVSHDLRTPLRAIDGFSAILQEKFTEKLPVEAQRYVGIVRSNTQKMGVLLDGMRDFLSINRKALKKVPVAPVDIIRGLIAYLKPTYEERKVEIVVGDLPACMADPEMLKLVFSHLLSNAIKFTVKCEVAYIEVGHSQEDGETIYFVKDNGIGFDMRYAEKVFSVYQRLHSQQEFEGIGLGLAMVKHVIDHHGGRIWVESEPGKGTTFFFTVERKKRD